MQKYKQTSEIISSLLEYFTASAKIFEVYLKYKQTSEPSVAARRGPRQIISSLLEYFTASAKKDLYRN